MKLLSLPHLVSERDLYPGNYSPEYHRASWTAAVVELVEVSMRVQASLIAMLPTKTYTDIMELEFS